MTNPKLTIVCEDRLLESVRFITADATDLEEVRIAYAAADELYDWALLDFWVEGDDDAPRVDGGIVPEPEAVVASARRTLEVAAR